MSKIPVDLIDVGFNDATVKLDVESLVRESMIKLFNVTNDSGNLLDPYDSAYFNSGLPTSDDPGVASMIKQFILLEGKILGFLFQQFLYMVKPIQIALQLPSLLAQPKKLIQEIKKIIEGIKKLIQDITKFFTKTKDWFFETLMGDFLNINIPIPEIPLNLLGIEITIPSIDKGGLFSDDTWEKKGLPNPYKQNLTPEVKETASKLKELRKKLQSIKDKSNSKINSMQNGLLEALIATLSLLYISLLEESIGYSNIMKDIYKEVLKKQDLVSVIMIKRKVKYTKRDKSKEIDDLIKESLRFTVKDDIKTPGNIQKLEIFADKLAEIVDDEEEYLTDIIDKNKLKSDATFNKNLKKIDDNISDLYQKSRQERLDINNTLDEIKNNKSETDLIKSNLRGIAVMGASTLLEKQKIEEEIKKLKEKLVILSPATAWIEAQIDFIVGIIRSPIDFIVGLISKIFQGIIEFIKQLPRPTFNKIKEFFRDIVSIPNVDKMGDTLSEFLNVPIELAGTVTNVMNVLPWLVVTVGKEFIFSVVQPLPIPI